MPRKAKASSRDEVYLFRLMEEALIAPEDDRFAAVSSWCTGDYKAVVILANEYGVTPVGILLLTLIDTAHPLLVDGDKTRGSLVWCSVRLLAFELHKESAVIPLYTPPVYNSEVIHSVHR